MNTHTRAHTGLVLPETSALLVRKDESSSRRCGMLRMGGGHGWRSVACLH